ncbi:MAG: DUF4251 domain-containing protein [Bacteroidales bacterium]|nr:DUF4251 domain-containing protein [Bacteroidales bacterium]
MKKVILISLSVLITFVCYAQSEEAVDTREQKILRKAARKQAKKLEEEEALILTKHLIDTRRFVLIADYVGNKRGDRIPVNSTINFLKIDTSYCVIQVGAMNGIGYNGVGGITAEGTVSSMETIPNKKGNSFSIRIVANTNIGNYDIVIFANAFGNADATITGITYGALKYYGRLVPVELSGTYQGHSF